MSWCSCCCPPRNAVVVPGLELDGAVPELMQRLGIPIVRTAEMLRAHPDFGRWTDLHMPRTTIHKANLALNVIAPHTCFDTPPDGERKRRARRF